MTKYLTLAAAICLAWPAAANQNLPEPPKGFTIEEQELRPEFKEQRHQSIGWVNYTKATINSRYLGIYAADAELELEEAIKEAQSTADKICVNNEGQKAVGIVLIRPNKFKGTDIKSFYNVLDDDGLNFQLTEIELPTDFVWNGFLDAALTSMVAYTKGVWEYHSMPHWEFRTITCIE